MLAGGASNGKVIVWDVRSSESVFATEIESGIVPVLAFTPDTEWLACVSRTEGVDSSVRFAKREADCDS